MFSQLSSFKEDKIIELQELINKESSNVAELKYFFEDQNILNSQNMIKDFYKYFGLEAWEIEFNKYRDDLINKITESIKSKEFEEEWEKQKIIWKKFIIYLWRLIPVRELLEIFDKFKFCNLTYYKYDEEN